VFRPDLRAAAGRCYEPRAATSSDSRGRLNLLTKKIDSTNFQGVVDLEYSNLWYAPTIEVK
jgi:hypothetical protein